MAGMKIVEGVGQKDEDKNKDLEYGGDTISMNQEDKSILVSFESGHYKKITGTWKGDSVWGHYYKSNGKMVHINLSKVEYLEEL